ncbi:variable surface lipoprotein [Metamycoplasma alkalescens]|uniref:variable surface lipoprotein n=1 Tax=Metamycoplasma alkalescens TaxID=45363 RepID=UPI0012674060
MKLKEQFKYKPFWEIHIKVIKKSNKILLILGSISSLSSLSLAAASCVETRKEENKLKEPQKNKIQLHRMMIM